MILTPYWNTSRATKGLYTIILLGEIYIKNVIIQQPLGGHILPL